MTDDTLEAHGGLRTELADWFYIAKATGVPVPRTTILPANGRDLWALFDGVTEPSVAALAERIMMAAEEYGYPVFVRTGLQSAKHSWKWLPRLTSPDDVMRTISGLAEMQEMAWLPPVENYVVREMLPTTPLFHAFQDMPIALERRYFIDEGKVVDRQAYWPISAIEGHVEDIEEHPVIEDWRVRLIEASRETEGEVALLSGYAERLAAVMPGAWSVDFLSTKRGWYFIDAAWAETSYVMPDVDREALGMPLRPEGLPAA